MATIAASLGLAEASKAAGVSVGGAALDALRHGGVTLFLRHAPSDWSQEATEFEARADGTFAFADCRTQRNLSPEGRDAARALGLALKSLKLAIAEVDAAPLCRTLETARLAFGQAKTVEDLVSRHGGALTGARDVLERLVKAPTPERALRVVVGDYELAQALFGQTLGEGDGLILRATPQGGLEAVARIDLDDWRALAPVAQSGAGAPAPVKRF
ncbi:MAG: histidine phosphatase family protein [Methylobacteriaceae bacterium]|nr:histidine phosphatase family protein [Methylobacteriaceae bacterium]